MAIESPYKFLDSYTEEDRDIFFGRDQEIEEVYKKVFQGQTLFIYGESGTGKSSLISCGLANRFKKSDWLPVNVRRGDNINQSLINELDKLVLTEIDNLNGSFAKNLYKYTRSIYLDYFKPIYFIFDQFEELYLMGTKEEWREFVGAIKALTEKDLNVHFIFIIRSEYLHFLSEFEEELPEVFNNKIRIEKITRQKAKECIEGPGKIFNIKIDDDFSDQLLDRLSPDSIEVELTYLQVYLDRVYKLASSSALDDEILFSRELLEDIGMVSDVLSDFLDEQIEQMSDQEATLTVLKGFVTIEGTKRQASKDDILSFSKSLGETLSEEKVQKVLTELLERRIIKELPDQLKFELRHDALAGKIFEKITIRERELIEVRQFLDYGLSEYKKRQFLLTEKDLAYIEPHLPVLDLTGEVKDFVDESIKAAGKKRRRRNRVIGIISIIVLLSITSIYGFFDAQRQREEALQQKELAEQNAAEAQNQRAEAENQRSIAEENASFAQRSQQLAEMNAEEAQRQAEIAQTQSRIAEMQRNAADSSRIEAEQQRLLALLQKDSAESARRQALIYLEQANNERAIAERLSMQTLARSLGIKSAQIPDVNLKSVLALQAYQFNNQFEGYTYQADIHNALYLAHKAYYGDDFNMLQGHTSAVYAIETIADNVYSVGADGLILHWTSDLSSNSVFANTGEINYALAISGDGNYLATGTNYGNIFVFKADNKEMLYTLKASTSRIRQLEFDGAGNLISVADDNAVKAWDVQSGTERLVAQMDETPQALAIHPVSNEIIVGLKPGGSIYTIGSQVGSLPVLVKEDSGDPIAQLRYNNEGNKLAIGYESGSIQLVDVVSGDLGFTNALTLPGHTAIVSDIKFSSDDRFLISGGYDRKNFLWNLADTGEPPISWIDHEFFVLAVDFSPSGKEIITGEIGNAIKRYVIDMSVYASSMCDQVDRNLTLLEWQNFVREDIAYVKTCPNK